MQVLKDHIRQTILDAAEKMFARVGYKKATMAAIAKEADVATGNIYRYFENKKELFNSIISN